MEELKWTSEPRDTEDIVELEEPVEGQGDGGETDLFKRGLSVPESMLERPARIAGIEKHAEDTGVQRGRLCKSWMVSWRAAWDRAWDVQGDSLHFAKMDRNCSMREDV